MTENRGRDAAHLERSDQCGTIIFVALVISLVLLAVSHCTSAPAAELILHGPSHHFQDTGKYGGYNNENYGVGYMFDNRILIGGYRNSLYRTSVYAGYAIPVVEHVGIALFAATGYRESVIPFAYVNVRVPVTKRWSLHVNATPIAGGVINLSLGYALEKAK